MNKRLKSVSQRRNDALSRVKWDRLEELLADHYRSLGYEVDHCGTGSTQSKFDGGVDLRLRRNNEFLLVQCKHWNACKVPHNDVHQLLGLVVNEGATGGILVTSGEFTKAAIEAAGRQGRIQLIEGDELRQMLGEIADAPAPQMSSALSSGASPASGAFVANAMERLVTPAEVRPRYGRGCRRAAKSGADALIFIGLKFAFAAVMLVVLMNSMEKALQGIVGGTRSSQPQAAAPHAIRTQKAPLPAAAESFEGAQSTIQPASITATVQPKATIDTGAAATAADLRERQRRSEEAMRILEATTPELQRMPVKEN